MSETDYQRAWRERGEAEAALRKWRRSQQSPAFIKGMGVLGGIVGGTMLCEFVKYPSWETAPMLFLVAMFLGLLFLGQPVLRDQEKARAEAKETLQRLGLWEKISERR